MKKCEKMSTMFSSFVLQISAQYRIIYLIDEHWQ